ncbi:hypothetical protein [Andreprevotia chitinilytica]|uniref:hypothetical protein n=1 Tax=Andreprevotia chitinilytica TaxID=396808 RepID=UPI00054F3259|nr:hypothetical protein [Andreprevotia chitinilytica]
MNKIQISIAMLGMLWGLATFASAAEEKMAAPAAAPNAPAAPADKMAMPKKHHRHRGAHQDARECLNRDGDIKIAACAERYR